MIEVMLMTQCGSLLNIDWKVVMFSPEEVLIYVDVPVRTQQRRWHVVRACTDVSYSSKEVLVSCSHGIPHTKYRPFQF